MKKSIIILGAIAVVLLMLSSATAVPTTSSEPVMEKVNVLEKTRTILERLDALKETIGEINDDEINPWKIIGLALIGAGISIVAGATVLFNSPIAGAGLQKLALTLWFLGFGVYALGIAIFKLSGDEYDGDDPIPPN